MGDVSKLRPVRPVDGKAYSRQSRMKRLAQEASMLAAGVGYSLADDVPFDADTLEPITVEEFQRRLSNVRNA